MERIQLAEDLSFSRIIHGLWRLADWKYSADQFVDLIEYCMEQGITTFDHADIYGGFQCEELFGNALALKPGLRENIEIVTKCGIVIPSPNRPEHKSHHYNTSKRHIIQSVENSLKNFRTDYIDTLLIHRPDPFMDPEQVASAFHELKASGKVRHFGVSNFKRHQLTMLESYLDVDLVTNQIELSAYQLENLEDGTLNLCLEKQIAPMAWSPLARGQIFTNEDDKAVRLRKTLEKIAIEMDRSSIDEILYAWILNHPANVMPIVGSSKKERIQKAVNALNIELSLDQWFEILHASMGHEVP
ncbi:aldo/keto reductase family oxidoreductase [Ornithinibacillus massiliensis]|uniref:Aldo/keto reductase family oxidoreductase n=1 Tax=Ornithinibacillus massiliensis TaxID=1944633 RepID=A0ABS5MIM8_9BACI|nr:aldo/keto reductase family oxidoreductase [Ornithinibacillus massiliensis]MBS3681952.1 aldo/keto reductase family oxidoreductase [Ornithinibacillus massiliensis]